MAFSSGLFTPGADQEPPTNWAVLSQARVGLQQRLLACFSHVLKCWGRLSWGVSRLQKVSVSLLRSGGSGCLLLPDQPPGPLATESNN